MDYSVMYRPTDRVGSVDPQVPPPELGRAQENGRDLEHRNAVLRNENDNLQREVHRLNVDLANYKETLKKFYAQYLDQQNQVTAMRAQLQDQGMHHNRVTEVQLEMKNDVKNLILDRDLLISKLEMGDKQYQHDVGSLTSQINDKNKEIADLRRRTNDLLDVKRKAEEEVSALRFTLDHQNTKLENELREKSLRLEQVDRQYADALYLKDRELGEAFEKIKGLEHEVRRLLDLNRNYAQELSMLARENRFLQEELSRLRVPPPSVVTINNQGETRAAPQATKYHDKVEQTLNIYDKTHERQIQQLVMTIWKLKMELRSKSKQNQSLVHENQSQAKGAPTLGKGSVDLKVTTVLIDGMIAVLTFCRTSANNIIFEVFVRSINHSNQKKLNSFIIFMLNLKELRQKYWKGIVLSLEVYAKLRKCLRHASTYLVEAKLQNGMYQKLQMAIGKLLKHDMDFRDNVNKWLEGTLAFTIQKKQQERAEKNQDFLFLFRLLTIRYRVTYPLRGQTFKVDTDIEIFLEHKITYALRRVLREEAEPIQ